MRLEADVTKKTTYALKPEDRGSDLGTLLREVSQTPPVAFWRLIEGEGRTGQRHRLALGLPSLRTQKAIGLRSASGASEVTFVDVTAFGALEFVTTQNPHSESRVQVSEETQQS